MAEEQTLCTVTSSSSFIPQTPKSHDTVAVRIGNELIEWNVITGAWIDLMKLQVYTSVILCLFQDRQFRIGLTNCISCENIRPIQSQEMNFGHTSDTGEVSTCREETRERDWYNHDQKSLTNQLTIRTVHCPYKYLSNMHHYPVL